MTHAMDTPKVSVILPCCNAHRFLGQAIGSARAQTFRDFEIVVVDDGSTDPETISYLNNLDGDVRVVRQKNRGLPGARNTGFREARGTYVVPLDCDDWLEPEFIEKALAALESAPDATFAFSHIKLEDQASGVLHKNYNFFEQLFLNQLPYCMLISRSAWVETGGYDETMCRGYEDWEFTIRLGGQGRLGVAVPEPLFHYRVSATGMLQNQSSRLHGRLWGEIQERNGALYRLPSLIQTWKRWRKQPSTYPLPLYFGWLALYRLLPEPLFATLFQHILPFSHSRRTTAAETAK